MTQRDQPGASEERLPLEGKLAARKGSRRGCTVGRCRRVPTLLRDAFPWGKVATEWPDEGR